MDGLAHRIIAAEGIHIGIRRSQRVGIAATTVASKMSLALTVVLTVTIFGETPSALAWGGIALAVVGVSFSSWGGSMRTASGWWLLPVIFLASAIYPYLQSELFIRYSSDEIEAEVDRWIDTLALAFAGRDRTSTAPPAQRPGSLQETAPG